MSSRSITALFATLMFAAAGALAQDRPAVVELQTNLGTIAVELDYANAPITADNFVTYVRNGFYQDTLIHRVVKDFVIQGGGFGRIDGRQKTTLAPIVNESNNGLSNLTGTIAMARTSAPNSATSQFFINLVDNLDLDYINSTNPGYAVFGRVVKGINVVKAIGVLPTFSQLPFSGGTGLNSTLVWIDAVYANDDWDTSVSDTRIGIRGTGTVVSDPPGIDCGATCTFSQLQGPTFSIKAIPGKNSVFGGWRGDCTGGRRTITLDTTKGNHNCTAQFVREGAVRQ
jgi:cyclophilin family peptidyl-prolyl cis-trans isomerase